MSVQWTVAEGEMRRTSQAKRAEGTEVPAAKIELAEESRHFDSKTEMPLVGISVLLCRIIMVYSINDLQPLTAQYAVQTCLFQGSGAAQHRRVSARNRRGNRKVHSNRFHR